AGKVKNLANPRRLEAAHALGNPTILHNGLLLVVRPFPVGTLTGSLASGSTATTAHSVARVTSVGQLFAEFVRTWNSPRGDYHSSSSTHSSGATARSSAR